MVESCGRKICGRKICGDEAKNIVIVVVNKWGPLIEAILIENGGDDEVCRCRFLPVSVLETEQRAFLLDQPFDGASKWWSLFLMMFS